MKKLLLFPLLLTTSFCFAAPPTRTNVYVSGDAILASDVTANEDAIFNYLQTGINEIKDGTIVNADVNGSANIQSDKLNLTAMAQDLANTGTFANTGDVTVTGAITVSGKVDAAGTIDASEVYVDGNILLPQGSIIMWSGATLPDGWELCDGTCSITCPDLRDKFIVGAGSTYAVTDTGGATTHTHTYTTGTPSANGECDGLGQCGTSTHTHSGTTASGSTLPPYRGLYFIIKI